MSSKELWEVTLRARGPWRDNGTGGRIEADVTIPVVLETRPDLTENWRQREAVRRAEPLLAGVFVTALTEAAEGGEVRVSITAERLR